MKTIADIRREVETADDIRDGDLAAKLLAVVEALPRCWVHECGQTATQRGRANYACDGHADMLSAPTDLPYAAALRALLSR